MADCFDVKTRSAVMRAVKSSGNASTELRLISLFKEKSIKGWRRNYKVAGSPDFVFPKKRVAVFADGCFWHGHDCRNTKPSANKRYWQNKIQRNMARDRRNNSILRRMGWNVVRLWECEINKNRYTKKLNRLRGLLSE